jgi:hypothetical protein
MLLNSVYPTKERVSFIYSSRAAAAIQDDNDDDEIYFTHTQTSPPVGYSLMREEK